MKTKVLIFLLLWSSSAFAEKTLSQTSIESGWQNFEDKNSPRPVQWVISPFGIERRLEAATNPVMETREPVNVALGLRLFRHLVSLEYSRFDEKSGNETYRIEREFQDLLGWYRYSFYKSQYIRGTFGGGLGIYQEQVTTHFYNINQSIGSGNKWTAATGLGLELTPVKYLVLFLEARLISGQNLDPNPHPDGLARISIQF